MKSICFSKLDWESNCEYEHYLNVYLSEPTDCYINVLDRKDNVVNCEIRIVSSTYIRIISDKLFDGKIVFTPKPPISEDKDRLERVKNEIERWSKAIEEMYKNNTINSSAYYAMKGFNVVLNDIIDN